METKETVKKYFAAIHAGGWEDYIAEDFIYANSFLDRTLTGKAAYIEAGSRFFSSTSSVELKQLIIDGDKVAVVARYTVKSPHGKIQEFDVAEFLNVKNGMLTSSAIFFDSMGLADFMAGKNN